MPRSVYGVAAQTLDDARQRVEEALGITLISREGLYHGGIYYTVEANGIRVTLQPNVDLLDDDLAEPDLKSFPYVLYVDATNPRSATEQLRGIASFLRTRGA
jgi:hypothetical protein